jgi:hypothetical protein
MILLIRRNTHVLQFGAILHEGMLYTPTVQPMWLERRAEHALLFHITRC